MAESYNEDDDLQRLKDWWRQNGLALILGVGAGLGGILAWQGWHMYVDRQGLAAAGHYAELQAALDRDQLGEPVEKAISALRADYPGTPYAAQGAMLYARALVDAERYDEAMAQLRWVVDYGDQAGLRHVARVRLARLLWAQDKTEQALGLLEHNPPDAFVSLYQELAGDIHAASGNRAAAQTAYGNALEHLPADADAAPLQRKLDSVAVEERGTEESA